MAQADLECYDEGGFVTLTAGTLFGRVLGSVNTGTTNGSAYFAGLTSSGAEPWYMSGPPTSQIKLVCLPRFTIANDTISWVFIDFITTDAQTNAPRAGCTVVVGTD